MARLGVAALALVAVSVLGGCAATPLLDAAYYGDLRALKQQIHAAEEQGRLDRSTLQELAVAVARREVASARGQAGVRTIRAASGCSQAVRRELHEQAAGEHAVAAAATRVLFDQGWLDGPSLVEKYADSSLPEWRAIAARAMLHQGDADRRHELFRDVDAVVRRGALEAAEQAADSADTEWLLEAMRLEPDATARGLATRAVGKLGGARAVQALADRWQRAVERERLAIVEAWGEPRALAAGGHQWLVRTVEHDSGLVRVMAATRLVRAPGLDAELGWRILAAAADAGGLEERKLALRFLRPGVAAEHALLERLALEGEPMIRVLASVRLLRRSAEDRAARDTLRLLARGAGANARRATAALAALGDPAADAALRQWLTEPAPGSREQAARGLLRLGRWSAVATVLADDDPAVRMHTACLVAGGGLSAGDGAH